MKIFKSCLRSMTWLGPLFLAGCVPFGGTAEVGMDPGALRAPHWIDVDALQDGPPVSLSFQSDSAVAGFAGCNRYAGSVQLTPQSVLFHSPSTTRMLCEPEAMDTEQRYLKALGATRSARMNKGVLELLDGQRKVLWRFKPLS